ncbi:hypothetical protein LCGC14_2273470, partial [marine sediment metagenome]
KNRPPPTVALDGGLVTGGVTTAQGRTVALRLTAIGVEGDSRGEVGIDPEFCRFLFGSIIRHCAD